MYRTLVLPLPPSDNALYFNSPNMRGFGRVPTKEFKDWSNQAQTILAINKLEKFKQVTKGEKITWKVHAICYLKKSNLWKSDLSNRFKVLFDKLAKEIGIDDRYLTFYQASKECLENAPIRNDIKPTEINRSIMDSEHVYLRLIVENEGVRI